jgi:hypothetical protein
MNINNCFINFSKLSASYIRCISVTKQKQLVPFEIQRMFWTYYTSEGIIRVCHSHHATEQVLIAATSPITVTTALDDHTTQTYHLDDPHAGLYMPPYAWCTTQYSHSAVQLMFASISCNEQNYTRNYADFKPIWTSK